MSETKIERPFKVDVKTYKKRGGKTGKKALIYTLNEQGQPILQQTIVAPTFRELSRQLRLALPIKSIEQIAHYGETMFE